MTHDIGSRVGCVVIGRNEGARLARCLASLRDVGPIVYVDSGSTDGSVALARAKGAHVVELDLALPFTAARARNAGLEALLSLAPSLAYVLFVDGDCEVAAGFVERAKARLDARPELAVVCGRRREMAPDATVYNLLCDVEWHTPVGDAEACGGDALMRIAPLLEVGMYDPALIAGEEPDLCLRLRRCGHRIERIDAEMTLHDARIERFSAWWRRQMRAGHAFAEGAHRHGRGPERFYVRETRRAIFFGAFLPALALGAAPFTLGGSLLALGLYPVSAYRCFRAVRARRGFSDAVTYAAFCTLGKLPEAMGAARFHVARVRGVRSTLIEYKSAVPSSSELPSVETPVVASTREQAASADPFERHA